MSIKYEIIANELGDELLTKTEEDGRVWFIPKDPANSDYQAYLNPVEHSTEIPTGAN